ncbi:BAHD acyltransferase At5g47980-like [Corylus avellana]|uniref:BAHD acyltransferase At5g47980-like n=1 Tax=Corylus avellana TaxID=13451 RepID=UPI00286A3C7D|nr:BAHD acyltransferase At5g47980-like [Corylus avellana]
MEIKVEIIKRETIKPSTPTSHHLRCFDLCLIDQLQPEYYTSLVLFYSNSSTDSPLPHAERSQRLKASLSETLTLFYPLAGKIKDDVSIDCNDDGADFFEARVYCRLSDILEQPEQKMVRRFLPTEIQSLQRTGNLVVVQATLFECGGMALGVGISHRLADASTTSMFIHGWACAALGSGEAVPPEFGAASRLPPRREFTPKSPATHLVVEKSATRRYVFDASKIAALRAKGASASVEKPTRVEAVSALIWRCATSVSKLKYGSPRPSKLIQMINIRKRLLPPSPENCFGNLVWCFEAQTGGGCRDIELHSLVGKLRKGIQGFTENYAAKFQGDEAFSVVFKSYKEIDSLFTTEIMRFFCCSSWCKFPVYETDFGWGKPRWVTIANMESKNVMVLMDTRDGSGIEAWVCLSEEDMGLFECDNELLQFASLNPSVN